MFDVAQVGHGVPQRAIVLLSGGIDSFACAHFLRRNRLVVSAAFVDFGQAAAAQELTATARVCQIMQIERTVIRLAAAESRLFDAGEIPVRNLALLATATLLTQGSRVVA